MWMEMQNSAQSSFQKLNNDNSCQKTRKIRYYTFEVLSTFSVFLQFVPDIFLLGLQLSWFYFLIFDGGLTRYSDRQHDSSVKKPRLYKDVSVNSLFPRTARIWNSLPIECIPLILDLNGFKSTNNRHSLTLESF